MNSSIIKFALKGIRSKSIEDVASEGNLALIVGQQRGLSGNELQRFVQHACRNEARRQWVAENRTAELEFTEFRAEPSTHQQLLPKIWDAVSGLPQKQQDVIRLMYQDGMTEMEVAARMGISQPAVNKLLRRALAKIKKICHGGL